MILSTAYAPPVQYFCKLLSPDVLLEAHDFFIKQTYRNRCRVLASNGVSELTIPVQQGASERCPIKEVRISDHDNWRTRHWQTLQSCYGLSPYFEYYADDIAPFYTQRYTFLFDFNYELMHCIARLMHFSLDVTLTEVYSKEYWEDFRNAIRPKKPIEDPYFVPVRYYQTLSSREDFYPNLSIFDLLFNKGPEGILVLQKSVMLPDIKLENI
ncbi:WbqC family protein [Porphyromonas circumdentaria]|uniref:WbqC-like protein family protein n=1 Tax=Porphyromonas circumdentaria TaxID=29524 RepID=A0A1T4L0K2_9PORP|nr:WbqC family protein [Porphyromonas circumdentaria]MBB6275163.1 hypothetical protein [Porphyromonas circumdentaria]MDO4721793.1 WbqC family protein [Porphyromonas circumdentaria]SJZ48060.1 WbqC-like protein family protein [Porphyromonas circumdentaria]